MADSTSPLDQGKSYWDFTQSVDIYNNATSIFNDETKKYVDAKNSYDTELDKLKKEYADPETQYKKSASQYLNEIYSKMVGQSSDLIKSGEVIKIKDTHAQSLLVILLGVVGYLYYKGKIKL